MSVGLSPTSIDWSNYSCGATTILRIKDVYQCLMLNGCLTIFERTSNGELTMVTDDRQCVNSLTVHSPRMVVHFSLLSCPFAMKRRQLTKKQCLLALIAITALIILYNIPSSPIAPVIIRSRAALCHSTNQTRYERVKYIFDLTPWRQILAADQLVAKKHLISWCVVPAELQLIGNAICRLYGLSDCRQLPCQLVSASADTLVDVRCRGDGRKVKSKRNSTEDRRSAFRCKRGISLDLFIRDNASSSSSSSYPSLLADPYSPINDDLYIDVLHNQHRSCNSMWGVVFNFESLSYYPWTGDPQKMKLFDATFGYDRSVYDFTPDPWLFDDVEKICEGTKRLSREEAMRRKKTIRSTKGKEVYWPQTTEIVSDHNHTSTWSYLQAPILWMNSNCQTESRRAQYVNELMKHIPVDNFGTCGSHLRPLPEHIVRIQDSANQDLKNRHMYNWKAGKLAMSSDYLFTIAIENSIAHDYITEKLWQPLVVGSVPIYLGAPNVDDWLPCRTPCIIDLRQFKSPHDAAKHIDRVAKNRTLYESYHRWRDEPLREQFEKMLKYFEKMREYSAECVLCDMSRRVDEGEDAKEMKRKIKESLGGF